MYFYNKHKIDDNPNINRPWVINLTDQGTNCIYSEISSVTTDTGSRINEIMCRSYAVEKESDGTIKLPEKAFSKHTILTQPNRRYCFARGTLDSDSEIIVYYPQHFENVNESFKNTRLYKLIEPLILNNDALQNTITAYIQRDAKLKDNLQLLLGSNLDEEIVQKIKLTINALDNVNNNSTGLESMGYTENQDKK